MKGFRLVSILLAVAALPCFIPAIFADGERYIIGYYDCANGEESDWNARSNATLSAEDVVYFETNMVNAAALVRVKYGSVQMSTFASSAPAGSHPGGWRFGHAECYSSWGDTLTIQPSDPALAGTTRVKGSVPAYVQNGLAC